MSHASTEIKALNVAVLTVSDLLTQLDSTHKLCNFVMHLKTVEKDGNEAAL